MRAVVSPTMPATVIGERIGWGYSIRTLSGRVAELWPVYVPPDPASRTTYLAGEIAQCDFWFPIRLPVGFGQTRTAAQLPVLTMITGYARWASALLLRSRRARICMPAGGGVRVHPHMSFCVRPDVQVGLGGLCLFLALSGVTFGCPPASRRPEG